MCAKHARATSRNSIGAYQDPRELVIYTGDREVCVYFVAAAVVVIIYTYFENARH